MKLFGFPYKIRNTVVEFEEGRRIAWRHFGGHRWRYVLEPRGEGTHVTESFDYSMYALPRRLLIEGLGFPPATARASRAPCSISRTPPRRSAGLTTHVAGWSSRDEDAGVGVGGVSARIGRRGRQTRRAAMDGQERQHAGWTVREYDAGASGPPVLLLPGGMCTTGFYDELAAQPLVRASSLRLVAATLPGHGGTAPLTDAGVENVARRASGLARDFDCRVVVGHSMGATVAIERPGSMSSAGLSCCCRPASPGTTSRGSCVPRTVSPARWARCPTEQC